MFIKVSDGCIAVDHLTIVHPDLQWVIMAHQRYSMVLVLGDWKASPTTTETGRQVLPPLLKKIKPQKTALKIVV